MNVSTSKPQAQRSKSTRRKFFDVHAWVGFNASLFLSIIVLTGTLAVIADELDWLFLPQIRASETATTLDWQKLEAAARQFAPEDSIGYIAAGEESYFNPKAIMTTPQGALYYVYFDGNTSEVVGRSSSLTIHRFLRDLHRYFFMPNVLGLPFVTIFAVCLLISLVTGLKTARNWLTLLTRIRTDKGLRVFAGDFHKSIGLWGVWFIVLITVTSLWYFAELSARITESPFEPTRPDISEAAVERYGTAFNDLDAGRLASIAQAALPGLRITEIHFASRANQSASVLGRLDDPLVRERANRVFIDPVSGEIIHVQRSKDIGWVAYLNELADPLHFGDIGGVWTKAVWVVFGLLLLFMTISGVWLSWQRLGKQAISRVQWGTIPLLIALSVVAYFYIQNHLDKRLPGDHYELVAEDEALTLTLQIETADEQPTGAVRLLIGSKLAYRLNITEVSLQNTHRTEPVILTPGRNSHVVEYRGTLAKPVQAQAPASVWFADIEFANGESARHKLSR